MALTISEANAVSHEYFDDVCYEQVYETNALLGDIKKGGRVKEISKGLGTKIQFPIRYKELGDAEAIDPDAGRVTVGRQTRTGATLDPKFYKVDIPMTWKERNQNFGPEQIIDLMKDKATEGVQDMSEKMSDDFYQAEASRGGNDVNGFFNCVQASTTSYAGIDQDDASNWNAGLYDTTTTVVSMHGTTASLWYLAESCWFNGFPDLFVTTLLLAGVYASKLQPGERRAPEGGRAGATDLYFNGIPVLIDTHVPTAAWLALTMKYLWLHVHPNDNFAVGAWENDPDSYKGIRSLMTFNGNFVFVVRRAFGAYTALTS